MWTLGSCITLGPAKEITDAKAVGPWPCQVSSRFLVDDRGMPVSVNVQAVHPRKSAAVRREAVRTSKSVTCKSPRV
jgi:hypothetical protein